MNKCKFKTYLPVLILTLFSPVSMASDFQVHGFISQGYISSNDNPFYDDTTGDHFNYREIALTSSWQLRDDLRLAGQILSRKAGDLDDGDPRIDFLLVDYNFFVNDNTSSGIRLGRVKNPYGIYNSTRDVPHVRPGVFVPQSVYFETLRDALLLVDGGNFYYTNSNSMGDFSLDLYSGYSQIKNKSIEYQIFQDDITGEFDEVNVNGVKFGLVPKNAPNLTLALSLLDISMELQDAPDFTPSEIAAAGAILFADPTAYKDYITAVDIDSLLTLYSIQYNWNDWVFTTEYLDIENKVTNYILYNPDSRKVNSQAYYFQGEWLTTEKLSIYGRYEKLYYNKKDKDGAMFAASTGGNPYTQYTKAYTLGARWYFTPDLSLTGEYSHNKGAAFIVGPDNIDYSALKEKWDLFILQLSYHF